MPSWIVLAVVALAAWAYSQWEKAPSGQITGPTAGDTAQGETITGAVRVVDGDSLEIGAARIRLFGIDAPELRQLCRSADGSDVTCGLAARDTLGKLIGGRPVSCAPAEKTPSYDRTVAVCTVKNSNSDNGRETDLSEAMLRAGQAIELKAHSHGRYSAAEREARDAKRGIWAGSFERPSEWRQRTAR
ncbi:MAG: thermonuclease family protein [Pseudolabrys sp.]